MIYLALLGGLMIGACVGTVLMGAICQASNEDLATKKAAALIRQQILLGNITFSNKWEKGMETKKEVVN